MSRAHAWRKEDGMASFMVTTVLILVISLIVVGFSQVARRNQREALDRQLSTQAFYAAESGVNAAVAIVQDKATNAQLPPDKNACAPDANYPAVRLDNDDVKVTCMLVSTQLSSLFYTGVTESAPTIMPIISANGTPIAKVTITWRNPAGGPAPSVNCTASGLTTRGNWICGHGVLRTDIAPTPDGNPDTSMSTFFNPLRYGGVLNAGSAPTVDYGSGGGMIKGYCVDGADPKCMASITGLTEAVYYMNIRSIYRDSSVTIEAQDIAGNPIDFTGQVMIDVTAKAQDVLRRIQVRVPLDPKQSSVPAYAIESSASLCKRYAVEPNYYAADPAVPCP